MPWISYNWGPYGVGANVLLAPGRPESGWAYTEEGLQACADYAASLGRKIAGLIITNPDNPTGNTLTVEEQVRLGKTALRLGAAFVLYDWMYHYVTDDKPMDLNSFVQAFDPADRPRLMFLDGITKSLGASNVRNAHLAHFLAIGRADPRRCHHGKVVVRVRLGKHAVCESPAPGKVGHQLVVHAGSRHLALHVPVHVRLRELCLRLRLCHACPVPRPGYRYTRPAL